jgi:hypothetical protein
MSYQKDEVKWGDVAENIIVISLQCKIILYYQCIFIFSQIIFVSGDLVCDGKKLMKYFIFVGFGLCPIFSLMFWQS